MNEVEKLAREICEAHGRNPNVRQREYGQSSYDFWTWELYTEAARAKIEAKQKAASEVAAANRNDANRAEGNPFRQETNPMRRDHGSSLAMPRCGVQGAQVLPSYSVQKRISFRLRSL